MNWDYETDVVIVGGGGAGLAAAVEASATGAATLLLEACPELGGTTGIAVGSFTAAGTRFQQAAGIADDPAWHAEDMGKFAPQHEGRNNAELRGFLAHQTVATLEWLIGLGLEFIGPKPEPPNRVARMHNLVPNAKAYIAVLQQRALAQGAQVWVRHRATKMYREPGGAVTGLRVEKADGSEVNIRARRGVILAAGDYSNGSELKSEYLPGEVASVEGVNPNATGDGHRMARQIGAALLNMEIVYGPEIRFVPPPQEPVTWQHPEKSLFQKGAILVNKEGWRFADENGAPELAIPRQPGKIAYILLDRTHGEIFSAWPNFISTAPQIGYAYLRDYARLRPDVYAEAGSIGELARRIGVDAATLEETVTASRIESAPFYALGPVKSWIVTTEGGVRINRNMEALDEEGRVIPGLYAAGSNGLGGMVLWGHGLHIAWATTSGRLAGRNAARG